MRSQYSEENLAIRDWNTADLANGVYGHPKCQDMALDTWNRAENQRWAHKICAGCEAKTARLNTALAQEGSQPLVCRDGCWGGTYPQTRYRHYRAWKQERTRIK